jgi:hypothetical protein
MSCGYTDIINHTCQMLFPKKKEYLSALDKLPGQEDCTAVSVIISCSNEYSRRSFFLNFETKYVGDRKENKTESVISHLKQDKKFSVWYYGVGKGNVLRHLIRYEPIDWTTSMYDICSYNWNMIVVVIIMTHFIIVVYYYRENENRVPGVDAVIM